MQVAAHALNEDPFVGQAVLQGDHSFVNGASEEDSPCGVAAAEEDFSSDEHGSLSEEGGPSPTKTRSKRSADNPEAYALELKQDRDSAAERRAADPEGYARRLKQKRDHAEKSRKNPEMRARMNEQHKQYDARRTAQKRLAQNSEQSSAPKALK